MFFHKWAQFFCKYIGETIIEPDKLFFSYSRTGAVYSGMKSS